jgi:hypothetical protein
MFSAESLIDILQNSFCLPNKIVGLHYFPTYSTGVNNLMCHQTYTNNTGFDFVGRCLFSAEEPLNLEDLDDYQLYASSGGVLGGNWDTPMESCNTSWDVYIRILANSEHSQLKRKYLKESNSSDWYFFYHGFAALDWFDHYKYLPVNKHVNFSYVFITYNHLIDLKRSYRMNLVANLLNRGLDKFGLISMPLISANVIRKEIFENKSTLLSAAAKKLIFNEFSNTNYSFVLDENENNINGSFSASINLNLNSRAFWHIVTETVFYEEKLHLTEKIFKPIVSRQPFILVGATNNLAYLKSYGFKTFDRWIDESYDLETDPDIRIKMIADQIEILSNYTPVELKKMHLEMLAVLDYNRDHFYGEFKKIIVDELVDNFKKAINTANLDRSSRFRIEDRLDYTEIKNRFLKY